MKKISVLIIDDSAVVRKILTEILNSDPKIEVVGTAMDPYIARKKIKDLNPDVLTLDVEMPKMDGLNFLRQLMRLRPMPVVMVSSLTEKGAEVTLDALEMGAIDFVNKPKVDIANNLLKFSEEIISKVKNAAKVKVESRVFAATPKSKLAEKSYVVVPEEKKAALDEKYSATVILQRPINIKSFKTTEKIIAIGASTGGTEAIKQILVNLSDETPAIVIAQHIPPVFSAAFAKRMNDCSEMIVMEASDGQQVLPGHAYIAPGDKHLMLTRDGARYRCRLDDGPLVNRHKPSVDVLFRSVAKAAGRNAIGIILTGMGADGARALGEMREAGAFTFAQDEKSSVVWGMPGEAVKQGSVQSVVSLQKIPEIIVKTIREMTH